jgi:hypothetical protein
MRMRYSRDSTAERVSLSSTWCTWPFGKNQPGINKTGIAVLIFPPLQLLSSLKNNALDFTRVGGEF